MIDRREFPKRKIPPAKQFAPPVCLDRSKRRPLQATKTTEREHSSQRFSDGNFQKGESRQQSNLRRPFALKVAHDGHFKPPKRQNASIPVTD
jgi:hypothetical protein